MKILVARHGETLWNEENKICGITDIELTSKGIKQAKEIAQKIKGLDIDLIISSPMNRTLQTSKLISDICNLQYITDDRLIEQDYGIYEGCSRKNSEFLNNKKNFAYKYPNGESMLQVACRVYNLIEELSKKYNDKNILIITHGGICRIINTYFNNMTNDEFFNYTVGNGMINEYEL